MSEAVSLSTSDIDFERERLKDLLPAVSSPFAPLPIQPVDQTLSSIKPVDSTKSTDSVTSFPPTIRPKLEHPVLPSIRVFQKMEKAAARQTDLFDVDATRGMKRIDRLYDEKEAAVQEYLAKEKSRKTWGIVATVIQYLATSASVILGIAAIAAKAIAPGVALVVSGALGLIARAGHDLNLFHKIATYFESSAALRDKLARRIEMGTFFLSFAGSLASGFWAYQAGAFGNAAGQLVSSKVGEGVQTGFSLVNSGFRVREAKVQEQVTNLLIKTRKMQLDADAQYYKVNDATTQGRKMMENLSALGSQLKRIISSCSHMAGE